MKICEALAGRIQINGGSSNNLRKCNRKAKYFCSDIDKYLCTVHLKKIRAFSKNPICLENGKEVDRRILYQFRKVEFVKMNTLEKEVIPCQR